MEKTCATRPYKYRDSVALRHVTFHPRGGHCCQVHTMPTPRGQARGAPVDLFHQLHPDLRFEQFVNSFYVINRRHQFTPESEHFLIYFATNQIEMRAMKPWG